MGGRNDLVGSKGNFIAFSFDWRELRAEWDCRLTNSARGSATRLPERLCSLGKPLPKPPLAKKLESSGFPKERCRNQLPASITIRSINSETIGGSQFLPNRGSLRQLLLDCFSYGIGHWRSYVDRSNVQLAERYPRPFGAVDANAIEV